MENKQKTLLDHKSNKFMKKGSKENRMVITYIPEKLHNDIRKWCIKNGTSKKPLPLYIWAEKAQKALVNKA